METDEIKELITVHEQRAKFATYWIPKDLHQRTAIALRFLLEERKNLVHATSEGRLAQNGQLHAESAFDADANEEIIGIARKLSHDIFGGNCAFVDDDIRVMAACAKWALNNGIPDEICPNIIPKGKAIQRGEKHLGSYGGSPDGMSTILENASPQREGDRPVSPPDEEVA